MSVTLTFEVIDILLFIIVALLAGSFASQIVERRSARRNTLRNIIIGAIGAFIGQLIFRLVKIDLPEFLARGITLAELLIATIGAVILLVLLNLRR